MEEEARETDGGVSREIDEVYRTVLPALDQLSHEDQAMVALNWVKYVLSGAAHNAVGSNPLVLMNELVDLCESFALQVMRLPTHYAKAAVEIAEQVMREGCDCAQCLARKKGSN